MLVEAARQLRLIVVPFGSRGRRAFLRGARALTVEPRYVDVPSELVGDMDVILGEIRTALRENGVPVSEDDLSFERPEGDTRGAFGGVGPQEAAMLFIGSTVATQITQRYAQEVLWPRLKPLCADATDALLHFLKVLAGGVPPR